MLVNFTISAILPDLLDNFENASAEVVQCPDLTQPPFNLTSKGEHKYILYWLFYLYNNYVVAIGTLSVNICICILHIFY